MDLVDLLFTKPIPRCKTCKRLLPDLIFSDFLLEHVFKHDRNINLNSLEDVYDSFTFHKKEL